RSLSSFLAPLAALQARWCRWLLRSTTLVLSNSYEGSLALVGSFSRASLLRPSRRKRPALCREAASAHPQMRRRSGFAPAVPLPRSPVQVLGSPPRPSDSWQYGPNTDRPQIRLGNYLRQSKWRVDGECLQRSMESLPHSFCRRWPARFFDRSEIL